MLRIVLSSLLVSAFLLPIAVARVSASEYDLIELDTVTSSESSVHLRAPILVDGDAYWTARNDPDDADLLFKDPGGQIASVGDLPQGGSGDVPLFNGPTDEHGGSLVLSGRLIIPAGVGTQLLNAYYTYPGFDRVMDYTTPVTGFPNDPTFSVPEHPPLFDQDGSIVFLLRDGTIFSDLRYAICRLVGPTVSILVEQDVTPVPGGGGATFSKVFAPTVSKGVILFYGEGGGRKGVYQLANGSIETVVDDQTVLAPNASPVSILGASDVAFANDGSDVAIALRQTNGGGVWKRVGGVWSHVASRLDQMPGGTGFFYDFVAVAIRDGTAAFASRRDNQFLPPRDAGVYTDAGGALREVASFVGDFSAEAPTGLVIAAGGRWFEGEDVVFGVENNAWGAFYRAVPEPGSALGTAVAVATLVALRKRERSTRS